MTPRVAHVAAIDATHRFLLLPQLRALRDAGFDVTAISAPGPWVGDIHSEGVSFIPWTRVTRSWDPIADIRALSELVGILRRGRFDLVHTHNPKPGVLGRVAARAAGTRRVVNTVHGYYATPQDRAARRVPVMLAERLASRLSDLELFQSREDLIWALDSRVVKARRAMHLGNGVDLAAFAPGRSERAWELRRTLGIADDELVVGAVGRLVREKGFEEFFEAARIVRRRVPTSRFIVAGETDGEKWDTITDAQVQRARDDVMFLGWRSDVSDVMGVMDVFVLPSWREGMPRSAIEAAASGLPMVLTNIRGCREVVEPGRDGLLVPVRDARRLADAITSLLEAPERRAEMGRAARVRAHDEFDEASVCDRIVGVTRRLLLTGSPSPTEASR